jgi:E3 ubiquitin-protein ligase XBAT32/33
VLNQRSHKSLTPLMLACDGGHAGVAAYLLREGADPLAADFVHSRTCLHYAAVGGHADCLRLLCSDAALVACPEGSRPLRDVIVSDMQVGAAPGGGC